MRYIIKCYVTSFHNTDWYKTGTNTLLISEKSYDIQGIRDCKKSLPWQIKSTFIMQFYFLSYKFKISYIPNYLIIYFVPLPLPSIAITPFSHISFSNFVVFDFPKGIYGAISLIGFNIVLLKSL